MVDENELYKRVFEKIRAVEVERFIEADLDYCPLSQDSFSIRNEGYIFSIWTSQMNPNSLCYHLTVQKGNNFRPLKDNLLHVNSYMERDKKEALKQLFEKTKAKVEAHQQRRGEEKKETQRIGLLRTLEVAVG